ncbi:MAG TPA: hypothetical protein VFK09_10835 [Gemmatimonadales bacterium]|nr:hypothetical protein [Gemmatimonadales bacterium]
MDVVLIGVIVAAVVVFEIDEQAIEDHVTAAAGRPALRWPRVPRGAGPSPPGRGGATPAAPAELTAKLAEVEEQLDLAERLLAHTDLAARRFGRSDR